MLGSFYPASGYPVVWSLSGAPSGVTIDKYGLITVSARAQLDDINHITVTATYHGKDYSAVLGITKARGGAPGTPGKNGDAAVFPKYRGVTYAPDTANTGRVEIGNTSVAVDDLDRVLYMGDTGNWTKARLYQWHEKERAWYVLATTTNTLEYMEALRDITSGAPDGIFSDIFCQVLFAQQAAINTLQSQLIQILDGGVIFGGERFTKDNDGTNIVDNGADKPGFRLGSDGWMIASKGDFNDVNISGNSVFSGDIMTGPLTLTSETPEGAAVSYSSGKAVSEITIANRSANVIGLYGGKNIIKIWNEESLSGTYPPTQPNKPSYHYSDLCIFYNDGTQERIARNQLKSWLNARYEFLQELSVIQRTSQDLMFQYTTSGKTLKLNVPTQPPTSGTGIVYRNSAGQLLIS
jgi:hypothetical protein